jgi:hypothetical protein
MQKIARSDLLKAQISGGSGKSSTEATNTTTVIISVTPSS